MAIYRFEVKVLGRATRIGGRSVVAAAAYRSGSNFYDDKYEVRHDYSRRQAGIVETGILAPANAPAWVSDREKLWNEVERKEDESNRRSSAQLAREFLPALPVELSPDQRQELLLGFVKDELVGKGMVADYAIHESKDLKNPHAHVLCTMREVGPEGFGAKKREWNDKGLLVHWRKSWEEHCNVALEKAAIDARVDCRSLSDRGIDREPQPKIGPAAAAMERRGEITHRGLRHYWHGFESRIRSAVQGIKETGAVLQYGVGGTWWERAQASLGQSGDNVRSFLRDESSWVLIETQRRDRQQDIERTSPDM